MAIILNEVITDNKNVVHDKFTYSGYNDCLHFMKDKYSVMSAMSITGLKKERYDNWQKEILDARSRPAYTKEELLEMSEDK